MKLTKRMISVILSVLIVASCVFVVSAKSW